VNYNVSCRVVALVRASDLRLNRRKFDSPPLLDGWPSLGE